MEQQKHLQYHQEDTHAHTSTHTHTQKNLYFIYKYSNPIHFKLSRNKMRKFSFFYPFFGKKYIKKIVMLMSFQLRVFYVRVWSRQQEVNIPNQQQKAPHVELNWIFIQFFFLVLWKSGNCSIVQLFWLWIIASILSLWKPSMELLLGFIFLFLKESDLGIEYWL